MRSPAFLAWAREEQSIRSEGIDGDTPSTLVVQKVTYMRPSPWALVSTSALMQVLMTYIPCHIWRGEKAVLYV